MAFGFFNGQINQRFLRKAYSAKKESSGARITFAKEIPKRHPKTQEEEKPARQKIPKEFLDQEIEQEWITENWPDYIKDDRNIRIDLV